MTIETAAPPAEDFQPTIVQEAPVQPLPLEKPPRLISLDVFRGITIAAMVLVNIQPEPKYAPTEHASWHGWTPTDLIFPFFLFIVGVAIPFSLSRRSIDPDQTRARLLGRIWLRALSLFMLGELLTGFPLPMTDALPAGFWWVKTLRIFSFIFIYTSIIALLVPWKSRKLSTWIPIGVTIIFYTLVFAMHFANKHALVAGWPEKLGFGRGIFDPDHLRIPGVLQRIGIVYGFAATIALFAGWRTILTAAIVLCAIYSAVMLKVRMPDHVTGSLTEQDNVARRVDVAVFDRYETKPDGTRRIVQRHTYSNYPDNEGLLSTIPAICTSLLGILVGLWLRTPRTPIEKCAGLLALGVPVTIFGCALDSWLMPINKNLWTPSFVVFCAGMAMLGLGFVFWLVDVMGKRRWAFPFKVFGMNSIAAFVAAGIVARLANLIKVQDGAERVGLLGYVRNHTDLGIQHASSWLIAHGGASLPHLYSRENASLAYALLFVLAIWVLMLILYVFKIFVKV